MPETNNLKIVVTVNKNDLWFCRICISSIRFYYPDIEIFLLKDELNGNFSTIEIEKYWNVDIIDLGPKKFGWAGAKMFLITDNRFRGQNLFVIDSDIIFIGKVLDNFWGAISNFDIFVSPEFEKNPYADWVKNVYFDVRKIQLFNSNYSYPGYFFNSGQLLFKGGFLTKNDLKDFFDFEKFPFWKKLDILPLVDQSLLNYIVPILKNQSLLKVCTDFNFMIWSRSEGANKITVEALNGDHNFPYLIHWAGDIRTNYLSMMNQSDLLIYFEKGYYDRIRFGFILKYVRKLRPILKWYISFLIRTVKNYFQLIRINYQRYNSLKNLI